MTFNFLKININSTIEKSPLLKRFLEQKRALHCTVSLLQEDQFFKEIADHSLSIKLSSYFKRAVFLKGRKLACPAGENLRRRDVNQLQTTTQPETFGRRGPHVVQIN